MSITLQEAVTALQADGPAVSEQVQRMTKATRSAQESVHSYEAALKFLQAGLDEQNTALVKAAGDLTRMLTDCVTKLNSEIGHTDTAVQALQDQVVATQGELAMEMQLAHHKLDTLRTQLEKLPPALRQAVTHQGEVLQTSHQKVQGAMGNLSHTVTKAVSEYHGLKDGVLRHQAVVTGHVETLVGQVKKSLEQAKAHTEMLDTNSKTVVQTFDKNLQEVLKDRVHEPGAKMKSGIDTVKNYTEAEVNRRIDGLLTEGLNRLLQALNKTVSDNTGIVAQLSNFIPDKLSEGVRTLSWVITHLDVILRELARRGIGAVKNVVNQGIDWLAKATGLNLDFLKKGVDAIAQMAQMAVDYVTAPLALARTLITDPAHIGNEIQKLISGARSSATSVGRLVGA